MAVYIIKQGDHGPFKIGYAGDVLRRLSTLQTASAYPLTIIRQYQGGIDLEKKLHSMFSDKRMMGEWFSIDESDIDLSDEFCGFIDNYSLVPKFTYGLDGHHGYSDLFIDSVPFYGVTSRSIKWIRKMSPKEGIKGWGATMDLIFWDSQRCECVPSCGPWERIPWDSRCRIQGLLWMLLQSGIIKEASTDRCLRFSAYGFKSERDARIVALAMEEAAMGTLDHATRIQYAIYKGMKETKPGYYGNFCVCATELSEAKRSCCKE